jgi:hypothetical protein
MVEATLSTATSCRAAKMLSFRRTLRWRSDSAHRASKDSHLPSFTDGGIRKQCSLQWCGTPSDRSYPERWSSRSCVYRGFSLCAILFKLEIEPGVDRTGGIA